MDGWDALGGGDEVESEWKESRWDISAAQASTYTCRNWSLTEGREEMTMEGSSAYHVLGKNCKKNTRRPQGEHCFTGRAVVCLQGFVSASANLLYYL